MILQYDLSSLMHENIFNNRLFDFQIYKTVMFRISAKEEKLYFPLIAKTILFSNTKIIPVNRIETSYLPPIYSALSRNLLFILVVKNYRTLPLCISFMIWGSTKRHYYLNRCSGSKRKIVFEMSHKPSETFPFNYYSIIESLFTYSIKYIFSNAVISSMTGDK